MCLAVGEHRISVRHTRAHAAKHFTRTMLLVLNHRDDRQTYPDFFEHLFCCFLVRLPTINNKSLRERPLRVPKPARKNFL